MWSFKLRGTEFELETFLKWNEKEAKINGLLKNSLYFGNPSKNSQRTEAEQEQAQRKIQLRPLK